MAVTLSASRSGKGRWTQRTETKQARDVACAMDNIEEVVPVPKQYIGLIIGTKGRRLEEIRSKTEAKIRVKDDQVYLRGTPSQREKAKEMIEEILALKSSPRKGALKKLDFIPEQCLGHVIGKGQTNLRSIETETGVTLRVVKESGNGRLCIAGSPRSERKAIRAIKAIVNRELKRSRAGLPPVRSSFVDAAQLNENHEFQLSNVQRPDAHWEGRTYKLDLLEHALPEETFEDFMNIDCLKEEILKVLKQIHKEKEEKGLRVDMWGHFGHIYLKGVDEDEEGEIFNLQEVKKRFESPEHGRWVPCFVEGVRDIEVKQIESSLPSQATTDDLRQDFTFYTPTCRDVRVKVWLVQQETDGAEGGGTTRTFFSRSAPVSVKNVLTQVLSDDQGDTSSEPNFHLCSQFDQRMRVNILMPSKGFDCRLSIRTCRQYVPETEKDEEEDKILESYLMGMKIKDEKLTLPPATELETGFDLFYRRRSLRRTYQYEIEGEQFSLTVCKEQSESVDAYDDTTGTESKEPKPDIHLHCEEWDRVLNEGDWEPEQIVAKLPLFLQFLRQVQRNVVP